MQNASMLCCKGGVHDGRERVQRVDLYHVPELGQVSSVKCQVSSVKCQHRTSLGRVTQLAREAERVQRRAKSTALLIHHHILFDILHVS